MSQPSTQVPAVLPPGEPNRVARAILDFVSQVPDSKLAGSADPSDVSRRLADRAAQRAALTAGSLALPPGPLGWLTLLPELIAIWRIQAQMVSDIAAAHGRHAALGREQMLWCLFRHTAAQAFRDLVVQLGDRLVFRRLSHAAAQRVAKQIGVRLTRRTLSDGLSRWLPVVGALGVGAYAYYDTAQVARTAIALFSGEVGLDDSEEDAADATPAAAAQQARSNGPAADKTMSGAARKLTAAVRKATIRKPHTPSS